MRNTLFYLLDFHDTPNWVNWIGVDGDGSVYGFNKKPKYNKDRQVFGCDFEDPISPIKFIGCNYDLSNEGSEENLWEYPFRYTTEELFSFVVGYDRSVDKRDFIENKHTQTSSIPKGLISLAILHIKEDGHEVIKDFCYLFTSILVYIKDEEIHKGIDLITEKWLTREEIINILYG